MAWLWTDTLAALLVEHDRVPPERVSAWSRNPIGYRIEEGQDPIAFARRVLLGIDEARSAGEVAAAG